MKVLKRWMCTLLSMLLLCSSLLFVSCKDDQGLEFKKLSDGTYGVKMKADDPIYLEEITIPKKYKGKAVTEILEEGFKDAPRLKKINIPNSVTTIGESAFYGCDELESVTIPDSVTDIGNSVFARCSNLESVTLGTGLKTIDSYAFRECSNLSNIVIPNGVTVIGDYAFAYCSKLAEITLPDSITTIDTHAFAVCKALTQISIPNNVTHIGLSAFFGCSNLVGTTYKDAIYLGNSQNPYLYLWKATSKEITSATVHHQTKMIGSSAFKGCQELINLPLGNSVESIFDRAFSDCKKLRTVIIPISVTKIGQFLCSGCESFDTVYYAGTPEEWKKIEIESENEEFNNATVYYYSESQPTTSGNYWRYVNDVATAWK